MLWNLKWSFYLKQGLLSLPLGGQQECQSADLKPAGTHVVLPILETACVLQLHSLGPKITQLKPKSDDVISPNNSPFSEPVTIVYTFPCQSVGVPLSASFFYSHWQLVLWTLAWNKHSFLGTGGCPHTLVDQCTALHYVCPSGDFIITGSALDQETRGGMRMKLHSFTSMSCQGTLCRGRAPPPARQSPWWVLTNNACLASLSGTIWSSYFNMTSGAFEVPAAGVKAL